MNYIFLNNNNFNKNDNFIKKSLKMNEFTIFFISKIYIFIFYNYYCIYNNIINIIIIQ